MRKEALPSPQEMVIRARCFSLRHTLDSGQLFRWRPDGAGFVVAAGDRAWRIEQRGDRLRVRGARAGDEARLRRFFALDVDLDAVLERLRAAGVPGDILSHWRGLRIVRQAPWECLVAFTCSSATNIPRIGRMMDALCRRWGRPLRVGDRTVHAFPPPGALGDERALREAGVGFRARYLDAINRSVDEIGLARLARLTYEDAKARLMALPGVGEKVADCVLLFAAGRGEAFPVDTWVRRCMRELFFDGRPVSDRAIREHARARFGDLAGYAQQYLFHEWRHRRRR